MAGDFNGSGTDQLAIAYAKWGRKPAQAETGGYALGILLFKYSTDFEADPISKNQIFAVGGLAYRRTNYSYPNRPVVNLAVGQFLFDPPRIRYGQQQLALAWQTCLRATPNKIKRDSQFAAYIDGLATRVGMAHTGARVLD